MKILLFRKILPYCIVGVPAIPIGVFLYIGASRIIQPQTGFGSWIIAFASAIVAVAVTLGVAVMLLCTLAFWFQEEKDDQKK